MKRLWERILIWLGYGYQQFQFLTADGKVALSLDGIRCRRCQNYFWVEDAHVEMPGYCCYCGTQFMKIEVIDNETFRSEQDSSD